MTITAVIFLWLGLATGYTIVLCRVVSGKMPRLCFR